MKILLCLCPFVRKLRVSFCWSICMCPNIGYSFCWWLILSNQKIVFSYLILVVIYGVRMLWAFVLGSWLFLFSILIRVVFFWWSCSLIITVDIRIKVLKKEDPLKQKLWPSWLRSEFFSPQISYWCQEASFFLEHIQIVLPVRGLLGDYYFFCNLFHFVFLI